MALWNAHRNAGRKTNGFGTLRVEYLEERNGPSSLLAGYSDVATAGWMAQDEQSPSAPD